MVWWGRASHKWISLIDLYAVPCDITTVQLAKWTCTGLETGAIINEKLVGCLPFTNQQDWWLLIKGSGHICSFLRDLWSAEGHQLLPWMSFLPSFHLYNYKNPLTEWNIIVYTWIYPKTTLYVKVVLYTRYQWRDLWLSGW